MSERKHVIKKIGPSDWVCLDNNKEWLWRFVAYKDGSAHGLDCDFESRIFWAAKKTLFSEIHYSILNTKDLHKANWLDVEFHLPSRKSAIDTMLKTTVQTH